jgi:hypothetical protein
MSVEVCSRMGLESSCAENVRDVWADHEAGVDVRAPPNRKRALKLSAGDRAVSISPRGAAAWPSAVEKRVRQPKSSSGRIAPPVSQQLRQLGLCGWHRMRRSRLVGAYPARCELADACSTASGSSARYARAADA